jgi:membrane-associated phospholipid phosphatase
VSRRKTLLALAATYAALSVLVATGALNGIDQWAVEHAMPGIRSQGGGPSLLEAAVPLLSASWSGWLHVVANIVTLPAQAFVSLAILVALRQPRWVAAWIGVDAVELLCKAVIVRPALHEDGRHIAGFDSSFPSGHTLRALLLAVALAAAWPRARWLLAGWAAGSLLLLEIAGHHVPSDIAGGIVLAVFVLELLALSRGGAARALRARGLGAPARGARGG